jgi:hypothetical protein
VRASARPLVSFFGEVPEGIEGSIDSLGREPEILNATTKRYPGTALNIVSTQRVLEMIEAHRLTSENVERIDVALSELRRNFADGHAPDPFASNANAFSSLQFGLAICLLDGTLDLARYDQFDNREILAVIDKMRVRLGHARRLRCSRVEITTKVGRRFVREGERYTFPHHAWLPWLNQHGHCLLRLEQLERLARLIAHLEYVDDIREPNANLVPNRSRSGHSAGVDSARPIRISNRYPVAGDGSGRRAPAWWRA